MKEVNQGENINFTLENEMIRRRLRTLLKLAIDIGRREGMIGTGMTLKQAKEVLNRWSLEIEHKDDRPISIPAEAESSEVIEPAVKEIRVRLPKNQWEQIGQVARRLRISHTALAHIWILEGLSRRT